MKLNNLNQYSLDFSGEQVFSPEILALLFRYFPNIPSEYFQQIFQFVENNMTDDPRWWLVLQSELGNYTGAEKVFVTELLNVLNLIAEDKKALEYSSKDLLSSMMLIKEQVDSPKTSLIKVEEEVLYQESDVWSIIKALKHQYGFDEIYFSSVLSAQDVGIFLTQIKQELEGIQRLFETKNLGLSGCSLAIELSAVPKVVNDVFFIKNQSLVFLPLFVDFLSKKNIPETFYKKLWVYANASGNITQKDAVSLMFDYISDAHVAVSQSKYRSRYNFVSDILSSLSRLISDDNIEIETNTARLNQVYNTWRQDFVGYLNDYSLKTAIKNDFELKRDVYFVGIAYAVLLNKKFQKKAWVSFCMIYAYLTKSLVYNKNQEEFGQEFLDILNIIETILANDNWEEYQWFMIDALFQQVILGAYLYYESESDNTLITPYLESEQQDAVNFVESQLQDYQSILIL